MEKKRNDVTEKWNGEIEIDLNWERKKERKTKRKKWRKRKVRNYTNYLNIWLIKRERKNMNDLFV